MLTIPIVCVCVHVYRRPRGRETSSSTFAEDCIQFALRIPTARPPLYPLLCGIVCCIRSVGFSSPARARLCVYDLLSSPSLVSHTASRLTWPRVLLPPPPKCSYSLVFFFLFFFFLLLFFLPREIRNCYRGEDCVTFSFFLLETCAW
ncbi:hypothetical protein LY76DRAFT_163520 [Colletotrichum caudatum]|nr:hypothetical protein LY76DRAFT_163520 [Colletotrichum caudatum]